MENMFCFGNYCSKMKVMMIHDELILFFAALGRSALHSATIEGHAQNSSVWAADSQVQLDVNTQLRHWEFMENVVNLI